MWSDPHHLQESYWWLPCPFVWCTWIAPASLRRIWHVVSSFWSYKGIRWCWLLWLLLSLQILSWVGNQGIFWFGHSIQCLPFQKVIYKSIDLFGCQRLKYQNVIAEISLEFCHFFSSSISFFCLKPSVELEDSDINSSIVLLPLTSVPFICAAVLWEKEYYQVQYKWLWGR